MKKILLLLLLAPVAFAQSPARYDMPVMMTTPGQNPVGSLPPLLAVTNATIAVCGYPAVLSGGSGTHTMCTNTITTYTDSTLATACPASAQLTAPGTSVCVSTTGLQGAFGFWYDAAVQSHLTYTLKTSWGIFGPFDILPGGGSRITLQTNGTPNASQSALNFSNTTPVAPAGYTNVLWQNSGGNESAYVAQTSSTAGAQCFLGTAGLVGAFTDSSGIVKQPLCIGNGPTSLQVPTGATQLLLGVDDNKFSDNGGSFIISASVNGGTATQYTVQSTSEPWDVTTNPTYTYGTTGGTAPILGPTGLNPGDTVTITYVSGTVSCFAGTKPNVDANGYLTNPPGNADCAGGPTGTYVDPTYGKFPTYYMGSGGGSTFNALTAAATGGAAPGTTFNGSAPVTFDYHSFGAQQALTLTTTGTSGPATLSGGALNIPNYATGASGVSSLNSLTGALSITGDSTITVTPGGSSIALHATGSGGGNSVQYSDPTTNYVIVGDSIDGVTSSCVETALPSDSATITAGTVSGTTATFTATNTWSTGCVLRLSGFTGSYTALNNQIITVLSTGLSGSQFEATVSGVSAGSTGTGVARAAYNLTADLGQEPFVNGHGTVTNYATSTQTIAQRITAYATTAHTLSPAVTGKPGVLIIGGCTQDLYNSTSLSTMESGMQTYWQNARADNWTTIIQLTCPGYNEQFSGSSDGQSVWNGFNDWLKSQGPTATNVATGQYWDRIVYVDALLPNANDPTYFLTSGATGHLTDSGNLVIANQINEALSAQGTNLQTTVSAPYFGGLFVSGFHSYSKEGAALGWNQSCNVGLCQGEADVVSQAPSGSGGLYIWGTSIGGALGSGQLIASITPDNIKLTHMAMEESGNIGFLAAQGTNWLGLQTAGSGFAVVNLSNQAYAWTSGSGAGNIVSSPDTCLWRDSGSAVDVGNCTPQDKSGTLRAAAVLPGILYSAAGTPLPACAAGLKGQLAVVSDATSPTYMGAYTSGGTITAAVICSYDGTTYSWKTH